VNPVAVKELRATSWRWQSYAGRGVYVAIVALIVFQFWAGASRGAEVSASEYAQLGRRLFAQFLWMNLALVAFASVAAAADGVTREVRTSTIGLLTASPLRPVRVLLGKWQAAMAETGCLILCGLPVLATCLYLGGVGFVEVAWTVALTVSTAAVGTAAGLRASVLEASAERAVVRGSVWVLVYGVIAPIPCFFAAPFIHPVAAALAAHERWGWYEHAWIMAAPCGVLTGWVLLERTARALEKRMTAEPDRASVARDVLRSRRGLLGLWGGQGGFLRDSAVWEDRPLLWKELATRSAGTLDTGIKQQFAIYLVLLSGLAYAFSKGAPLAGWVVELVFVGLATLLGATLFLRDKEGRRLELLLSTPFTPMQIVRTKLAAGLLTPEAAGGAALWVAALVAWGWRAGPAAIVLHGLAMLVFFAFAYVLAATVSLRSRTLQGGVVTSAAALGLVLFALPFVASVLPRVGKLQACLETLHPAHVAPLGAAGADAASLVVYATVYVSLTVLFVVRMSRDVERWVERGGCGA